MNPPLKFPELFTNDSETNGTRLCGSSTISQNDDNRRMSSAVISSAECLCGLCGYMGYMAT